MLSEPIIFEGDAAEAYSKGTVQVLEPAYDFFASEVAKMARSGDRVLDVGTGHGIVLGKLVGLAEVEAVGIDASESILRVARRRYPEVLFRVDDASRLGFKDGTFDIVISTLSFHHFDRPSALKEMLRVLRPGGTLVIFDFDGRIHPVLFAELLVRSGRHIAQALPILGWGLDSVAHCINEDEFAGLLTGLDYRIERHGMFLKVIAMKTLNTACTPDPK